MNTSLERLQEIEAEREAIMSDINFQQWLQEYKVGRMATKPVSQAREMMSLWKNKEGVLNSFAIVVGRLKNKIYL
jgi:hypothetical protein